MDWNRLFEMQNRLDKYISDNHDLEYKNLFEEKFLALLVELGELANETRSFKFWSKNRRVDRQAVLEEYVDNIHFLLSIGLEKGFQFSNMTPIPTNKSKTEQFNTVFRHCITFYEKQSEENYLNMVQSYLQLANVLGFTEQHIFDAYLAKNEVNYHRQMTGY